MPIVAMKITAADRHPNADRLRVYTAEAGDQKLTFVANLTNTYEVGDVAAVAQEGTTLEDGTQIVPTKLRGVDSFGMGLGKVDVPVGTVLTGQYNATR